MLLKLTMGVALAALMAVRPVTAVAQTYHPDAGSPLTLLAAPGDPIAYFDAKRSVQALLAEGNAAAAEPLAEQIVRSYPQDGSNWLLLARARFALEKYAAAAEAYTIGGELLSWGGPGAPATEAAVAHLRAGDRSAALASLRQQVTDSGNLQTATIYDWPGLAELRTDPEFLSIAGRPDGSGWSREEGWTRDLDYIRDEVLRSNAEHQGDLPSDFLRQHAELRQNIANLSDQEIYVGMNRMLAGFRQGHTSVLATKGGRLEYRGLPFQFWTFPEGIFIAQAAPGSGYERYIGSRLVSIEAVRAEEALRQVNQTQSIDGQNEYLFFGTDILREANYLVGLHIARSAERVELTLEAPDGESSTIVVETFPERAPVRLLPTGTSQPPLYLRQADQLHWHEALPEHDALYVQLNGLSDEPGETLEQYGLRLRAVLEEADPKSLIIDMRHNAGGSTNLYPELLRTLVAYSVRTDHKVYVLIGRRTYSAAGNLITELEQLADAVFLGEASSECCVLYGSPATFTLPYSGLRGSISTRRWSLSRRPGDRRRELHPDVPVQLTAADYFAGRDPVMEAAVRLIERGQSDTAHQ